ncbi:hypothetical protein, conserved in T. vivax [Trypanosoma vivax Y486]|uniref:Uncharacterized protein n=1 Tax=Trypanosoma vivax (strain Y486) TaxID=1055687 RepID=F9WSJ1_TRYVY|nr:hypothetical protein, conserved in T. vivax [Trypanosoma vivax Y486]|eukprot:CCD20530.1 hypothetical protein, conserved in T. vivax [Trypanosoma vivax Y486]
MHKARACVRIRVRSMVCEAIARVGTDGHKGRCVPPLQASLLLSSNQWARCPHDKHARSISLRSCSHAVSVRPIRGANQCCSAGTCSFPPNTLCAHDREADLEQRKRPSVDEVELPGHRAHRHNKRIRCCHAIPLLPHTARKSPVCAYPALPLPAASVFAAAVSCLRPEPGGQWAMMCCNTAASKLVQVFVCAAAMAPLGVVGFSILPMIAVPQPTSSCDLIEL